MRLGDSVHVVGVDGQAYESWLILCFLPNEKQLLACLVVKIGQLAVAGGYAVPV